MRVNRVFILSAAAVFCLWGAVRAETEGEDMLSVCAGKKMTQSFVEQITGGMSVQSENPGIATGAALGGPQIEVTGVAAGSTYLRITLDSTYAAVTRRLAVRVESDCSKVAESKGPIRLFPAGAGKKGGAAGAVAPDEGAETEEDAVDPTSEEAVYGPGGLFGGGGGGMTGAVNRISKQMGGGTEESDLASPEKEESPSWDPTDAPSASSTDTETGVTTTVEKNPDGTHTVTQTDSEGNEISKETTRAGDHAATKDPNTGITTTVTKNPDGTRTVTQVDPDGFVLSTETKR